MTVVFSPAVLQSEQAMDNYLRAQETVDAIKAQSSQPYVKGQGQLGNRDVIWIAMTSPLNCFIYFARYVIANAFYYLGATNLSLRLIVQTEYILGNENRLINSFIYGSNLLVPTLNKLSPKEAEEIYTHPPVPLSNIPEKIQHRFYHYIRNGQIHFNAVDGQCAGLTNLFAYLFFQTRCFYKDEEHLLVAIASKMNNGAGKEAALWQKAQKEYIIKEILAYPLKPLLDLKKKSQLRVEKPTVGVLTELFKLMKPGLYRLVTKNGGHQMCFYKGSQFSYAFDPNVGLLKLSSDEPLKKWIEEKIGLDALNIVRLATETTDS